MHAKHSGAITWTNNQISNRIDLMRALTTADPQYYRRLAQYGEQVRMGRVVLAWLQDPMSDQEDWWEERSNLSYYKILYHEAYHFAAGSVPLPDGAKP